MNWTYRYTVLTVCMLAFFVTFFARLAISPVVPFIARNFQVTNTQIGVALSGMWIGYALFQFPSGVLADKYGERAIILVAVSGTALMSLLLALTPHFLLFAFCVVALGAVAGLHYTVGTTLLSRTWDEMGFAVSIHSLGAPIAGVVTPVTAAWLGTNYGWRVAVGTTTVLCVPVFLLVVRLVTPIQPRRPERSFRGRQLLRTVVETVSNRHVAFTLLIAVLGTFSVQALISFLPTFLVDAKGYSATFAGLVFSGYFLSRGGIQIAVGTLSDRISRDLALAGCMLGGAIGIALVVASSHVFLVVAGTIFLGLGASFFPALDPKFLDGFSDSRQAGQFGVVRTVYGLLGGLGAFCVGFLADAFGWNVAFSFLGTLYLVAFCALVWTGFLTSTE